MGPLLSTRPAVPQGFDRKSCVTQAVSLSTSTFPPSSIGNAYLRKSANTFHLALPALTVMPLLETSTRQLTTRAATGTPEGFPSLNCLTSNVLSQGKKKTSCSRHLWENNLPRGEDGLPWGPLLCACSHLCPPNILQRREDLRMSRDIMAKTNQQL